MESSYAKALWIWQFCPASLWPVLKFACDDEWLTSSVVVRDIAQGAASIFVGRASNAQEYYAPTAYPPVLPQAERIIRRYVARAAATKEAIRKLNEART